MEDRLINAKNPVVLLSGGMDSLVVLDWARKTREIPVVTFNHGFTSDQWKIVENVIKLWDLECYSWPPSASYLIPNGENLARIDEYGLGAIQFPVLRDFVHGDRCALKLPDTKLDSFPWNYDVVFTGSKKCDLSPATGQPFKSAVETYGDITFCQPLFDLSDEDVRLMAVDLPFSREFYIDGDEAFDTGSLVACHSCLKGGTAEPVYCVEDKKMIPGHVWDRSASLDAFRGKFGFSGV